MTQLQRSYFPGGREGSGSNRLHIEEPEEPAGHSNWYLVSDGGQQSVEACGEEHASSKRVSQRQQPPVSVSFLTVNQQEADWDQYAGQHEAEQPQQAEQLRHQDLHPEGLQALKPGQRHHTKNQSAAGRQKQTEYISWFRFWTQFQFRFRL